MNPRMIFVGEAPNSALWNRLMTEEPDPLVRTRIVLRLALTGRCGDRIASLLGIDDCVTFARRFQRTNLNVSCHGKEGAGHKFHEIEGIKRARLVIDDLSAGDRVVMCGKRVARAFGFKKIENLNNVTGEKGIIFFLLPHPSGLVKFWNDPYRTMVASSRLKRFVHDLKVLDEAKWSE